jgi:hypothetical protein
MQYCKPDTDLGNGDLPAVVKRFGFFKAGNEVESIAAKFSLSYTDNALDAGNALVTQSATFETPAERALQRSQVSDNQWALRNGLNPLVLEWKSKE